MPAALSFQDVAKTYTGSRGTVRALAHALQQYFGGLKANGTTAPFRDRMLDFAGINRLLGTDDFLARGKAYDKEAAE